ncbi:MAG: tetratricopeptide repeat protein [Syntrophaceae bacterium]|nr:tetratricopeptide repeat protein [Syntrophaceae bacterium]
MLVKLLLSFLFIVIGFFLWLAYLNPMDVEFHFFGKTYETDLSILMISSFVSGALLVFIGTLARDAKRAFDDYLKSHQKRKEESLKEELNKGMDVFLRGDLAKAKTHFAEVLKRDPTQIDLYLRLSEIALREGKDQDALHWLGRAELIDMRNIDILLHQAEVYQRMKRFDEAIRSLNRAVGLDETNIQVLKSLRHIYFTSRRWEEAIRIQRTLLKLAKGKQAEEEETLFYLGLKYERARDLLNRGGEQNLEDALKEAKEIVRERKTFQPGFVLLGDIYLQKGRWSSAGNVWGKSFTRFKSIVFMLRLEELYLSREDPSTLLRIYQRALKMDPENWVLNFFYAKLCLRLEMLDEALEEINEISFRVKDFPALHRILAEIYLHKKDFSRAAQEFERTFELSGTSYLSFFCTTCERESKEWMAYCPHCHQWSTYTIKEAEKAVSLPSPSFSERVHPSL